MTRKQKREQIEKELRDNILSFDIWQSKPYTAVNILTKYDGEEYQAYGFTKVRYPDTFDGIYGAELALDKAIAKIAKGVLNES